MTTGERIRAARIKQGMTQKELAQRLDIAPQGIVQWENGSRNPKPDSLKRIAAALDVSYWELAGIPDSPNGKNFHYLIPSSDTKKDLDLVASMILNDITALEIIASSHGKNITPNQREQLLKEQIHQRSQQFDLPINSLVGRVLHYDQNHDDIILNKNDLILKELLEIINKMKLDGRMAVLHHARELAKIPDYQKSQER